MEVEPAELEKCEEISEVSANTICTQSKAQDQKCDVSFRKGMFCYFLNELFDRLRNSRVPH